MLKAYYEFDPVTQVDLKRTKLFVPTPQDPAVDATQVLIHMVEHWMTTNPDKDRTNLPCLLPAGLRELHTGMFAGMRLV